MSLNKCRGEPARGPKRGPGDCAQQTACTRTYVALTLHCPIVLDAMRGCGCVEGFARGVVRFPVCVLVVSGLSALLLAGLAVVIRKELPEFSNAQKGFESRGTELAGLVFAAGRGLELKQCDGDVSGYPDGRRTYQRWAHWADEDDRVEHGYCTDPIAAPNGRRRLAQHVSDAMGVYVCGG